MRTSIKILVTALILSGTSTAFGAGGGEVGVGTGPGMDTRNDSKSPEIQAKMQFNTGVRAIEKADELDADAARQTDPKKRAKLTEKARSDYSAGLKKFLGATKLNSTMYEAWNYAGYASRKLGNYDDALIAYDRALSIKPGYPEAIEYRGHAFLALNRLSEAKEAYLTLYTGNRKLANQLLTAMRAWVGEHRTNAGGIDAAMLDSFASWVTERGTIAGQTVGLTREGASARW